MSQILPITSPLTTEYGSAASTTANQSGDDFSRVFSETLTQALTEQALTGLSGASSTMLPNQGLGDLQSTLLAGAVNGQAGDNELMMFMMMMMMQEFGDSDMGPMMSAIFSALPSSGSTGSNYTLSGSAATAALRTSSVSYKGRADYLPSQAWLPTSFKTTSSADNRSAALLRRVIDQFNVEGTERYEPYRNGNTYCNIFLWDVTRAMNCEIPHYVDRTNGAPRSYPNIEGAYELDANGTHDWLVKHGANYGWKEVSAEQAQSYANAGYPAVTAWKNSTGSAGHVQVVCPSANGGYDAKRGVTVAQAGSKNYSYAHINATMSKDKLPNVRYFIHA